MLNAIGSLRKPSKDGMDFHEWVAMSVLHRALCDAIKPDFTHMSRAEHVSALEWIENDDEEIYSFRVLCQAFGLNHKALRGLVLRMVESGKAAGRI